jgi:hypothetical protein
MKDSIFYPETNGHPPPTAEVEIHTPEGVIKGLLHKAEGARGAILMAGDAGGGLNGPAGLYEPLAERLQKAGITALRIDYREPDDLRESIYDALAGIEAGSGACRVARMVFRRPRSHHRWSRKRPCRRRRDHRLPEFRGRDGG